MQRRGLESGQLPVPYVEDDAREEKAPATLAANARETRRANARATITAQGATTPNSRTVKPTNPSTALTTSQCGA